MRKLIVMIALLLPGALRAQAESADSAWRAGDVARAERLYAQLLAADSGNDVALHRMALLLAWRDQHAASLALFDRLLRQRPDNQDARVDRARVVAWQGDTRAAVASVDSVLALDARHAGALQARAQFLSWSGEYEASLRAWDRLLELDPQFAGARTDRARVLTWAERFDAATAAYDSILRANPEDTGARLGLAQVLGAASRLDSARAIYESVLARDPASLPALQGLARVLSWDGHLVAGERAWRDALVAAPSDIESRVGLAQVLRWQARDAAALEMLQSLPPEVLARRDVREQLDYLRLALAPRVTPAVTYESDTDDNRILTSAANASYRPVARSELRADAYLRRAGNPSSAVQAWGGTLSWWQQLEPGWTVQAGAGLSGSDAAGKATLALLAALTTPARYPVILTLTGSRSALDATEALVRREVRIAEVAGELRWTVQGWNVGGSSALARLDSRVSGEDNRRWSVSGAVNRRVLRPLVLGARLRTYGYAEDTNDGYFDPELYALGELSARVLTEKTRWALAVEGGPGVQRVVRHGQPGTTTASYRANGRLSRIIEPGRQVGLTFAIANSAVQQLSAIPGGSYRYLAFGISAGWTF